MVGEHGQSRQCQMACPDGWFGMKGLLAAPIWLLVATAIGGGRLIWLGADPAAWSLGDVAAPLALGWVVQVLVGGAIWTPTVSIRLVRSVTENLSPSPCRRIIGWIRATFTRRRNSLKRACVTRSLANIHPLS